MEKIAVVVVETYSAKLIIANSNQDNFFSICDSEYEVIPTSLEMDEDHFLKKNQIASVINILKNFRKICDMYAVTKTIAIASFIKESEPMNIYSFFDEVFVTCGFRFSLFSIESARLSSNSIATQSGDNSFIVVSTSFILSAETCAVPTRVILRPLNSSSRCK